MTEFVIGIDTGGTFTDFVVMRDGEIRVHKEPSTPDNPASAILTGLERLGVGVREIVHGSTVATNALLERRGARTALLTTEGFQDVLEIGRQTRPAIYDLEVTKPAPLVDRELRLGIVERAGPSGEIITPLDRDQASDAIARLGTTDVESVAVCLLHSYANPLHEEELVAMLSEALDGFVTASHQVVPEFREYERMSTTVANAYVGPVMQRYLGDLDARLPEAPVRIMQSNGGSMSLESARRSGVQTILSGPAGGVVGGARIGSLAGFHDCITFDMGGTSTDVSLCRGAPQRTTESSVGALPIRLPVLDIHTVGAGGGSVAYRDPGGALRVGPRSSGAQPGPICYGRGGEEITVTDANLLLGRISETHFLGGEQTLDRKPVEEAMARLAASFGMAPLELAEGIAQVANTTMAGAIRVISVERGFDPRDFALMSFGGAGSMHAAALAADLGIPRVVVPAAAGILSALGMLLADIVRDYSRTLMLPMEGLDPSRLEEAFRQLESRAVEEFALDGLEVEQLEFERSADLRYVGQGYELEIPMQPGLADAFHEAHSQRYGYADAGRAAEVVNVRVRATAETDKPAIERAPEGDPDSSDAVIGERTMIFDQEEFRAPVVDREALAPGSAVTGPALVVEYSTTTVVPPDIRCRMDGYRNLVLEISR